jgi:hypothetical protein
MKKFLYTPLLLLVIFASACVDNDLEVTPNDSSFPFRLVLDADEGADLPDAEDYGVEIAFADFIGKLPEGPVTLSYEIEGEDSFEGEVEIDKVVYEVEIDDCTFERELDFNANAKTIVITKDTDLGSLPESFEVVFALPGKDDTEGSFTFKIAGIQVNGQPIVVGEPREFEYEVFDNDVAGEWELEIETKSEFERFKEVFGLISPELNDIAFEDITGDVKLEFEFDNIQFEVELKEAEDVCEDGETETENKVIEIEADYDAEDGELVWEGSHFIIGDDGEIENELDFVTESGYEIDEDEETITITIFKIIDEDHFEDGDELFVGDESFTFKKD